MTRTQLQMYRDRRVKLGRSMKEGVAVFLAPLPGQGELGKYRTSTDLVYLTGLNESHVALVVRGGPRPESHLFLRPFDQFDETWNGPRATVEGGQGRSVDGVHPLKKLELKLAEFLKGSPVFWASVGADEKLDQLIRNVMKRLRTGRGAFYLPSVRDPGLMLHPMRQVKSSGELLAMRRAATITALAYEKAIEAIRPDINEGEIEALLHFHFQQQGGEGPSYGSIVGTGNNACFLHYSKNNAPMKSGDLMLIDAGAQADGYACDVTRTYPVSGTFSPVQARVYDIVLAAHAAAIRQCRPGVPFARVAEAALKVLAKGLMALGIFKRTTLKKVLKKKMYQPFYPHGIGHWLGLSVHDVGPYTTPDGKPLKLKSGMVLTVEPGLYFPKRNRKVPVALRGIGVRIEDDIVITRSGHEMLTKDIPRERAVIEKLMRGNQFL